MSVGCARAEIERAFPALAVHEIGFLGAGMDSAAYLVNGALVFRFPKDEAVSRALSREIALLPKLADRLPVAIPRFEYVGRQAPSGLLFVGYPLIPGEPLTPEAFTSLAAARQESVLDTLAAVLCGVHSFPSEEAVAAGVEPLSTRDRVRARWSEAHAKIVTLLTPDDSRALARLVESFIADEANFEAPPCLLYADFAPEHLLHDPASGALTGLIDWGDMTIGDPDYDLLYLYQDYGEGFVRRLATRNLTPDRPNPDTERLIAKLRVFNACDYLRDIVSADPTEAVTALAELTAATSSRSPPGSVDFSPRAPGTPP